MMQALESLRNLAGVLFWGLADVVLGGIWLIVIVSLLSICIKRMKRND